MKALILLRHSLTEANERRLYYGWTDVPLSPAGRELCLALRAEPTLPACDCLVTSGMARTNETLRLLTEREPDFTLPDLREMHFGRFEMHSYEELRGDPDYQRWISGDFQHSAIPCPGGESQVVFSARVRRGGQALLALPGERALAVLHGGVIVNLMQGWFPDEPRGFYDWSPAACHGYHIALEGGRPRSFTEI